MNSERTPEDEQESVGASLSSESTASSESAAEAGPDEVSSPGVDSGAASSKDERSSKDESAPKEEKRAEPKKAKPSPVLPSAAPASAQDADVLPTAKSVTDDVPFDWYVIRVQSGREDTLSSKISKKLQLVGHDRFVRSVVVPKQKISEVRDGKKRVREMKLYPGYFFMEMQLVEEIWYLLRDTPGVGDFVGGGAKPIPMTASEVKRLNDVLEERERDEPPEIKIEVDKNDTVKIKEGPFENFEGVVEEVHPAKGQVRVMVTIFGRETPVDLEYWQVEKV